MNLRKNKKVTFVFVLILIIGITVIFIIKHVSYNKYLYDSAIDYLKDEYLKEDFSNNQKENYQIFFDYKGFGILKKNNKKYAYMWILQETYYTENGEIKEGTASSMPYKIEFENDKVVNYQVPEDGAYYISSVREIFPKYLHWILYYNGEGLNVDKKVVKYYTFINKE